MENGIKEAEKAVSAFPFGKEPVRISPYGEGHINMTFLVEAPDRSYILQRINTKTFQNPDQLMENIYRVTDFQRQALIRKGQNPDRSCLTIVCPQQGGLYYLDGQGSCWRVYLFVEDSLCLQQAETVDDFYQAARAFGSFQALFQDFDASLLHETIPDFHDTRVRMTQLEEAAARDLAGRKDRVGEDLAFVRKRKAPAGDLMTLLDQGVLPLRVTHNDTKLNNVLFDRKTREALCVIDLDTVMPGLSLNDFGDAIRFGASTAAEDETDLAKVRFDLDLFRVYVRGFLETAGPALVPAEIDNLAKSAWTMTLECGSRFLADYLNGDIYFKVSRPDHNLDRAKNQFKLVREMEDKAEAMQKIVQETAAKVL